MRASSPASWPSKVGSPSGSPTGMAVKLTITESDQSDTGYAPVKDKLVCVGNAPLDDAGAISVTTDTAGGELVNFDLDLVGLKQYVKVKVEITCSGGTSPKCEATAALALGDASEVPV